MVVCTRNGYAGQRRTGAHRYGTEVVDTRPFASREAQDDVFAVAELSMVFNPNRCCQPEVFIQMLPGERVNTIEDIDTSHVVRVGRNERPRRKALAAQNLPN